MSDTPPFLHGVENPKAIEARLRGETKIKPLDEAANALMKALRDEITTMTIASRFSDVPKTDKTPFLSAHSNTLLERGGEAALKRAQLARDLTHAQNEYINLIARLSELMMDIEATKTEG